MKYAIFLFSVSLTFLSATPAVTDPVPPAGYTETDSAEGDLDKDNIAEKAIVYSNAGGTKRVLHIFKLTDGNWKLWHKSSGAALPESDFSVMRFRGIRIERGCIVLSHSSENRGQWSFVHRFRYQQGKWKLIGATEQLETPCEHQDTYDYNLSTGAIVYTREKMDCAYTITGKSTKTFNVKPKSLPDMDGFAPTDNAVNLPGTKLRMNY